MLLTVALYTNGKQEVWEKYSKATKTIRENYCNPYSNRIGEYDLVDIYVGF